GGALSHACLPAAARRSSMPRRTAGGRSNRPRTRAGRQSWASAKTPGVLLPRWIRRGQTARRMNQAAKSRRAGGLRSMPAGVWALGLVSLLMDVSSEMIHALLPVFLVGTLGASYTFVGVMEGVAEAIASITKIFSGAVSDRLGRRKPLAVLGYGLAAVTKPMFALSAYPAGFLSDRLDRYGVLGCGAMLLVVGDIVLAFADTIAGTLVGVVLWGLHMGFTQGLFAALVADASDERVRGTAFGVFNFVTGVVLLAASVLAGVLWERFGPDATFLAGAGLTAAACVALWVLHSSGRLRAAKAA